MCKQRFRRNFGVLRLSRVRSSHDLCACAHAHNLEGTLVMTIQKAKRMTRGCKDRSLNKITEATWSLTHGSFIGKKENFELDASN